MRPETEDTTGRALELRGFLLGTLPEAEAERIEDSLLSNEALYELLLATEEELIDEYLTGDLSEEEGASLLGYLDRLPDGRARLELGRELGRRLAAPADAGRPKSRWGSGFFALRPALAAAALLALAAILYFAVAARGPEPLILTAGLTRSGGEIPAASLSRSGQRMVLLLDLGVSSHARYRATLYDVESEAIETFEGLTATSNETRIQVSLALGVTGLPPGDYSIALEGQTTGGYEPLGRYVFRLIE